MPLFSGIEAGHAEALLQTSLLRRLHANVELVREGERLDYLHLIVDGQVDVFSSYLDRETTVVVLGPGDCFFIASVILDNVSLKSARTLTPVRVLMVPADTIRKLLYCDAGFARAIAQELACAYRRVVKEFKNQKLRSTIERLANFLLTQYDRSGAKRRFMLPFEKKVLASRLGMTPEVLSRSFMALVPYSVRVCGVAVEIHDVEALRNLAKPSSTIDDPAV